MDRRTWWATVYRITKSRTQLKWLNTHTRKHQLTYGMKCNRKPYVTSLCLFPYKAGVPWWLSGKEPTCQCRRLGFNTWVRKIPWRRKWHPMDRGAWKATIHGVDNNSDDPKLWDVTPDDLRWRWPNNNRIKLTMNVMLWNYPETITTPQTVENLSSTKPVPGTKKGRDCC